MQTCKIFSKALLLTSIALFVLGGESLAPKRSFKLENDRFVRDGKPIQIFSGRQASASPILMCAIAPQHIPMAETERFAWLPCK